MSNHSQWQQQTCAKLFILSITQSYTAITKSQWVGARLKTFGHYGTQYSQHEKSEIMDLNESSLATKEFAGFS